MNLKFLINCAGKYTSCPKTFPLFYKRHLIGEKKKKQMFLASFIAISLQNLSLEWPSTFLDNGILPALILTISGSGVSGLI